MSKIETIKLPESWILVQVCDVADIAYGKALREEDRAGVGGVAVYSSSGLAGEHNTALHEGPSLIIGRKGNVGSVYYSSDPFWCIDTTFYLENVSPAVNLEFMGYMLRLVDLARNSIVVGVPGLNRKDLERQRFPLPPLPEQERVIALLDHAEYLQQLQLKAKDTASEFTASLFQTLFGDPGPNPKGWDEMLVEELLDEERGMRTGPFGSLLNKAEYTESGIPVWGINNVGENEFVPDGPLYISERKFDILRKYDVVDGDVLISRAGTVGRMAVARIGGGASILGTNLIRASLNSDIVLPDYFTSLFTHFNDSVGRLRAGGDKESYSFTKQSVLKRLSIPIPPLPLQERFVALLEEFRALRGERAEVATKLQALYESLLSRAFTGELTEAWREAHREELGTAAAERDALLGIERTVPAEKPQASRPALNPRRKQLLDILTNDQSSLLSLIRDAFQKERYVSAQSLLEEEALDSRWSLRDVHEALTLFEQAALIQRVRVEYAPTDETYYVPAQRFLDEGKDEAYDLVKFSALETAS